MTRSFLRMAALGLVTATFAMACAAPPVSPPAPQAGPSTAVSLPPEIVGVLPGEDPAVVADCRARGGSMQMGGMLGQRSCVFAYADAGKSCTDGDQCLGDCLGQGADPGQKATGQCQRTSSPFGCRLIIEDGVVMSALCVD